MKYRTHFEIHAETLNIVGFLTTANRSRQINDGGRSATMRWALVLMAASVAALLAGTAVAADRPSASPAWQSTEEIAHTAEDFLRTKLGGSGQHIGLQTGWLDPRLQMPHCSEALSGFLRRGSKIASRTVVGVRCDGSSPWKMYVPVDVIVNESVLIAIRTLPGGHVLTADDVRVEQRDVSTMVNGYLSSPDQLIGQRLKQQLMAGRAITPSMLQADVMIHRGQSVTILVKSDSLSISMSGKALTDGAANQRIKVENVTSKRVIEGLVRSPEHVEVLVY
jgi:flagella basal body P-ring formation protein FlgA